MIDLGMFEVDKTRVVASRGPVKEADEFRIAARNIRRLKPSAVPRDVFRRSRHYLPAQGDIDKLSARRFLGAAARHAKFFYGSAEARAVSRDIKAHCYRESRAAIDYFLPCCPVSAAPIKRPITRRLLARICISDLSSVPFAKAPRRFFLAIAMRANSSKTTQR